MFHCSTIYGRFPFIFLRKQPSRKRVSDNRMCNLLISFTVIWMLYPRRLALILGKRETTAIPTTQSMNTENW